MAKPIHPTVTLFFESNGTIQFYPTQQDEAAVMMACADMDDMTQGRTIVVLQAHEIEALIGALQGQLNSHRAFNAPT